MLTYAEDEPIIRNAIMKRLDKEPGVRVVNIKIKEHAIIANEDGSSVPNPNPFIAVGVEWMVHDLVHGTSIFHLPPSFEINHIHNEVDEIAEGCKEAKRKFALHLAGMPDKGAISERYTAKGTGERGNWKYGERTP